METEKHEASENMQKFFKNLLDIKQYVKELSENKCDERHMKAVYERLDKIIKNSREGK